MVSNRRQQRIQHKLLDWYKNHQRNLPWRKTRNPYRIWISEVMLQQTQVDRVIPKYRSWLKTFPNVQVLARAPLQAVLQQWSGLGYNRRGLNLRAAAQKIVTEYHGRFPTTYEQLVSLPGVGEYTAKAILAFAFRQHADVIDTNVRRVIGRVQFGVHGATSTEKFKQEVGNMVPRRAPDIWHHAVMDLGATVCVSRAPKCQHCPLQQECNAYPTILQQPYQPLRRQSTFKNSDRFWRGRIVASLIHQPDQKLQQLAKSVAVHGPLPQKRFLLIIQALERSGLVEKKRTRVRLVA